MLLLEQYHKLEVLIIVKKKTVWKKNFPKYFYHTKAQSNLSYKNII